MLGDITRMTCVLNLPVIDKKQITKNTAVVKYYPKACKCPVKNFEWATDVFFFCFSNQALKNYIWTLVGTSSNHFRRTPSVGGKKTSEEEEEAILNQEDSRPTTRLTAVYHDRT
jgi:hypothetical protein